MQTHHHRRASVSHTHRADQVLANTPHIGSEEKKNKKKRKEKEKNRKRNKNRKERMQTHHHQREFVSHTHRGDQDPASTPHIGSESCD